MYTSFFGLNEKPFSITPNPRYLYMSERHTEALAHLIYGITESGGFIQMTGEVGTGKTTLIRGLLQQLPDNADVALILNPQLSAPEFLAAIHQELGIRLPHDKKSLQALTASLNRYLLDNYSEGRRTLLIVDEAQNFAVDVLEQIRLLTNLETVRQKLLQITLIGQPELRTMLARPDLRQLAQRITGRYHLEPLSQSETYEYVQHRLRVAGATSTIFDAAACRELYRLSGGVPRIINVIADRAMLGAFTTEQRLISPGLVRQAAQEVYGQSDSGAKSRSTWLKLAGITAAAVALIALASYTAWRYANNAPASGSVQLLPDSEPARTGVAQSPAVPIARSTIGSTGRTLEQILREQPDKTTTRAAFQNLFRIWGIEYESGNARACEQARNQKLSCLFQRGSLTQIQRLNRPVILTLQDDDGGVHQVVMAGMQADEANLEIGGEVIAVPLTAVSQLWYGEYLLLWKPQIEEVKSFYPGMTDPDVMWIRKSLATIQGSMVEPVNSEIFDEQLEARVREYQVERHLNADGLVGQQTQIAINSDLGIDTPRLVRAN